MTALLLAHHTLSVLLAVVCWWVAHEYARDRPPGRLIAAGWSLVGIIVMTMAFVRHHSPDYGLDNIAWTLLALKAALLFTEACVIARLMRRRWRETTGNRRQKRGQHP